MIKNNKIIYSILILIVVIFLFSSGCLFPKPTNYEKGVIRVVFMPNIENEDITLIIQSHNCTVNKWYGNRSIKINDTWQIGTEVYVNIPIGKEKDYIALFDEEDAVYKAYLVWEKV